MLDTMSGRESSDKDAALNAKIAAIRAANEARERRHKEVEADRLEAVKNKSAVVLKGTEAGQEEDGFRNPFEASGKVSKKPTHERLAPVTSAAKPKDDQPQRRSRGRLADDDGPPPDPGYSFLADRMRDGSPETDESPDKRGSMDKNRVDRSSKSRDFPQQRFKKEPVALKKSGGGRGEPRGYVQDEK